MKQEAVLPARTSLSWLRLSLLLLCACSIVLLFSVTVADIDLWGHLRYGLDNLQSGRLVTQDHYSYLSGGIPWINHEWLSETLFAIAWTIGGTLGLTLLKLLVSAGAFALIGRDLVRRGANLLAAGPFLILGAGLATGIDLSTVRPQIFSILMLTLLLLVLVRVDEGRRRWLLAVPPLMAAWANLHGGVLAGLGVLGLWSVVYALRQRDGRLPALLTLIAAVVATFINPYGPRLLLFLLETATVSRPEIWEWNPVSLTKPFGLLYLAFLAVSVLGVVHRRGRLPLAQLLLYGLLAFLPLVARRHVSLFAVGGLVLAGPAVASWVASWPVWQRVSAKAATWVTAVGLVLAVAMLPFAAFNLGRISILSGTPMPTRIVAALKQINAAGRMAVEFSWGEYVLWHLGPQVQVSIDGRRETVYSPRIYDQNLAFLYGQGDWSAVLDNGAPDMALLLRGGATYNLMSLKPGWRLALQDGAAALFVRQSSPLDSQLTPALLPEATPGRQLQFP